MNKREIAIEFIVVLRNHLEELKKNRIPHVMNGNTESIKRYDGMIKNTLKSIDKMDRIINNEIRPYKSLKEHNF